MMMMMMMVDFYYAILRVVMTCLISFNIYDSYSSHRIHVCYIYLHLVDVYGKCRYINLPVSWILWAWMCSSPTEVGRGCTWSGVASWMDSGQCLTIGLF